MRTTIHIAGPCRGCGVGDATKGLPNSEASNVPALHQRQTSCACPRQYREWIFLSSGLAWTSDSAEAMSRVDVRQRLVTPARISPFCQTGKWPRDDVLLEVRAAREGIVNNGGHTERIHAIEER